jgi:hypothetical protein
MAPASTVSREILAAFTRRTAIAGVLTGAALTTAPAAKHCHGLNHHCFQQS